MRRAWHELDDRVRGHRLRRLPGRLLLTLLILLCSNGHAALHSLGSSATASAHACTGALSHGDEHAVQAINPAERCPLCAIVHAGYAPLTVDTRLDAIAPAPTGPVQQATQCPAGREFHRAAPRAPPSVV